jgi:hypothetical protein
VKGFVVFWSRVRKGKSGEPRAEQTWSVSWRFAAYLGGLEELPERSLGTLWFTEEAIGLGKKMPSDVRIPLSEVASVAMADSRAPTRGRSALARAGLEGAKPSTITVFTKAGSRVVFCVRVSAACSKAAATAFLERVGIPLCDETASGHGSR